MPTMTQAFPCKHFQQQSLMEKGTISSAVMQVVLLHALQLRRGCREVFLLCDVQRLSVAEATLILGISQATARRRLRLARQLMQDATEHFYGRSTTESGRVESVNQDDEVLTSS